jgi:hypothetical protein
MDLVHELARTRPQLLIGTVGFGSAFDRAYTRGTNAWLWERPESAHTHGLEDHSRTYTARVLSIFKRALLRYCSADSPATARVPPPYSQ